MCRCAQCGRVMEPGQSQCTACHGAKEGSPELRNSHSSSPPPDSAERRNGIDGSYAYSNAPEAHEPSQIVPDRVVAVRESDKPIPSPEAAPNPVPLATFRNIDIGVSGLGSYEPESSPGDGLQSHHTTVSGSRGVWNPADQYGPATLRGVPILGASGALPSGLSAETSERRQSSHPPQNARGQLYLAEGRDAVGRGAGQERGVRRDAAPQQPVRKYGSDAPGKGATIQTSVVRQAGLTGAVGDRSRNYGNSGHTVGISSHPPPGAGSYSSQRRASDPPGRVGDERVVQPGGYPAAGGPGGHPPGETNRAQSVGAERHRDRDASESPMGASDEHAAADVRAKAPRPRQDSVSEESREDGLRPSRDYKDLAPLFYQLDSERPPDFVAPSTRYPSRRPRRARRSRLKFYIAAGAVVLVLLLWLAFFRGEAAENDNASPPTASSADAKSHALQ